MAADLTRHWINKAWETIPGQRTVLYYGFLLTQLYGSSEANIRTELKNMVSLQEAEFDAVITEFVFHRVISSASSCALTNTAMAEMEQLLERDLGSADPVPFDGVAICRADAKTRNHLWLEQGAQYLCDLFGNIPGLVITQYDPDRYRRILTLEWTGDSPTLIFCFVNTDRMTRMAEIEPLRTHAEGVSFARLQRAQAGEPITFNGLKTISIMAAPTYSTSVASAALNHRVPTRLIGPINLAAIGYYLQRNPRYRQIHYQALLEFLDPIEGGVRSGIVFAPPLIEYMGRRAMNWSE